MKNKKNIKKSKSNSAKTNKTKVNLNKNSAKIVTKKTANKIISKVKTKTQIKTSPAKAKTVKTIKKTSTPSKSNIAKKTIEKKSPSKKTLSKNNYKASKPTKEAIQIKASKKEKAPKNNTPIKNNKKNQVKNITPKTNNFTINSFVVYPSHGVGKIINIETTKINQIEICCYLIFFEREKLTIRIPVQNVDKFGIRSLVSKSEMDEVFSILRSGIKKMKGMWSRRAQEYETKINSGDIIMLAEVIRDLTRDIEDSERSYSERIIYETAIFRLASEYSAIYGISLEDAQNKVLITAKDKLESETKSSSKRDDFDDFDKIKDPDEDEEEDDEEEEDEDDEFNYEYKEGDDGYNEDDDDEDDKPKKKKK